MCDCDGQTKSYVIEHVFYICMYRDDAKRRLELLFSFTNLVGVWNEVVVDTQWIIEMMKCNGAFRTSQTFHDTNTRTHTKVWHMMMNVS